jgi:CRP-like cAMP-binding protein
VKFSTIARFEPHGEIFGKGDPGDCLYGILSGRVRIYSTSPEGSEIMLNVLEPGELVGEIALLDGSTRTAGAAAMEHTDLLRIHRDHFLPYVKANPDLILGMLSLICQRLRWTSSMIEDTAFLAFPARLAKRLLVLAEHYRRPQEHDITVPLSQHDLGSMVGAGREAINKQLALWRSAGIVETAPPVPSALRTAFDRLNRLLLTMVKGTISASWRLDERRAIGAEWRRKAPLDAHAQWNPPADRPDPVQILVEQGKSRIEELLPSVTPG